MLAPSDFFDLTAYAHTELFQGTDMVWDGLKRLKNFMDRFDYPDTAGGPREGVPLPAALIYYNGEWMDDHGATITCGSITRGGLSVTRDDEILQGASVVMAGVLFAGGPVALGKGVLVETGAFVRGPAMIGDCSEVRHGAYLRGYCLVGRRCVVGHTTEVKHSIFMDDAKAGHFAYLGDSILGRDTNLGAGTKLANLRFTGGDVPVRTPDGTVRTGLKKLGAIFGDGAQSGCNSVTNPGTLLGKRSILLPNTTAPSGYHPPRSVIKGR